MPGPPGGSVRPHRGYGQARPSLRISGRPGVGRRRHRPVAGQHGCGHRCDGRRPVARAEHGARPRDGPRRRPPRSAGARHQRRGPYAGLRVSRCARAGAQRRPIHSGTGLAGTGRCLRPGIGAGRRLCGCPLLHRRGAHLPDRCDGGGRVAATGRGQRNTHGSRAGRRRLLGAPARRRQRYGADPRRNTDLLVARDAPPQLVEGRTRQRSASRGVAIFVALLLALAALIATSQRYFGG